MNEFENKIKQNIDNQRNHLNASNILEKLKLEKEQILLKKHQKDEELINQQNTQNTVEEDLSTNAKQKTTKKSNKFFKWVLLFFVLLLTSGYFFGTYYFKTHFIYGTKIIGHDVSFKNLKDAQNITTNNVDNQKLEIDFDNNKKLSINYSDANYIVDVKQSTTNLLTKQNSWLWFIPSFTDYKLVNNVHVERDVLVNKYEHKLSTIFEGLKLNEYITYDSLTNKYKQTNKPVTNQYLTIDVFNQIIDAIKKGETKIQVLKSKQINKQIQDVVLKLNKIIEHKINIKFGNIFDNIDGVYIAQMIDFTSKGINVDIDKLASTLQFMARQHQKIEKGKITTFNALKLISQIKNDVESFKLNDYQADQNVIPLGKNNGQGTLKLSGSYIEVNISAQQMYVWKDSKLVKTFNVITGDHLKGRDTPLGIWEIWSKQKNKVLKGSTVGAGKDYDYEIPVKYWMAIDFTGVGLHSIDRDDVTGYHGRVYWGKDTYLIGKGSHGCVNMHTSDAGWVFENMGLKTKVYVTM